VIQLVYFGESLHRPRAALTFVVRESCYRFYKPSYTELSNGCSQEVQ
jgi:hypothetical protein